MKVGVLYICTGKYSVFWKEFYMSMEQYFLVGKEKEYFVFTNATNIYEENKVNVHKIFQEPRNWPYNTLLRFEIFLKAEQEIALFDYIFFFNANYICCKNILWDDIIPKGKEKLTVARHPGFSNYKYIYLPFERNKASTAYIPYNQKGIYYMGCLNGGETKAYLELIHTLKESIEVDLENAVIACVHDESHLNRYCMGRDDVKILSTEYAYPEDRPLKNTTCKMMLRDKSRYFDVKLFKEKRKETRIQGFLRRIKKFLRCNVMFLVDEMKYGSRE